MSFEDGLAAYQQGDYTAALRLLRPLAEGGLAEAQYELGKMYYDRPWLAEDYNCCEDYAQALKWYRKAADQGLADAQYKLGKMYYEGHGVPQDYAQALKWYRKAADQGLADAQYKLGQMYYDRRWLAEGHGELNRVLAHMWSDLAASQGRPGAATRDLLAKEMTPAQLAEAQRLAREWKPK